MQLQDARAASHGRSRLERLPSIAAVTGAVVGVAALLGWILDVSWLRTFIPGISNPMPASSALCFILTGTALWLLRREDVSRSPRWLGTGLALVAASIGLLKVGQSPGQMALPTAITFVLVGAGLAGLDVKTRRGGRPAQIALLLALLFPVLGLIGSLYGVPTLSSLAAGTAVMALHTSITFLVLCSGALAARPSVGAMRIITGGGPAGLLLRRLLPGAIVVVVAAGWLRLEGQRSSLYGTGLGAALMVILTILLLSILMWRGARSLFTSDLERREAEERTRANEERFEALAETTPDAIVIASGRNEISYFNPGAEAMFGYVADEVVGAPITVLMPERYHTAHREGFARYLATGEARVLGTSVELEGRRKDGSEFPLELSLSSWSTAEGVFFTGIIRDTTARREAERAIRQAREEAERVAELSGRLASVVEDTDDAIVSKNPDGIITSWNRSAEALYGYTAEEAIGNPIGMLIPPDRAGEDEEILARVLSGTPVKHRETRRVRKDGAVIDVSLTASAVRDAKGTIVGASAIARDITEQKRAQEEVRRAREAAEEASRAKSDFLSRMSHELRTPLNAILGFGQLMEMDDLDPDHRENLTHILRAGRHLVDLIEEVLDISRIEAGRLSLSLEPVALDDTVRESLDLLAPSARDRGIALEWDAEGASGRHVLADRQRLKQVLLNLLSNAVKYNRPSGEVRVSFDERNGRVRLEVGDTGPGILPEERERLFVPFERLGEVEAEGTGLGLALSKGLVEAMGGRIGMESRNGEGSVFWVELLQARAPMPSASEPEHEEPPATEDPDRGRTVLHIEDNPVNLGLVEKVLARRPGVRLLSAMQGRLGLELARVNRPDLVLLDAHLPDMPGEEVLRRLRGDPTTRDIPVVVISADAMPERVQRLLGLGARAYLTKPLDVRRLLKLVTESADRPIG